VVRHPFILLADIPAVGASADTASRASGRVKDVKPAVFFVGLLEGCGAHRRPLCFRRPAIAPVSGRDLGRRVGGLRGTGSMLPKPRKHRFGTTLVSHGVDIAPLSA
jgi:hypothetical protein